MNESKKLVTLVALLAVGVLLVPLTTSLQVRGTTSPRRVRPG